MDELRGELEVSTDATIVQKDIQRKRDEEFVDLKKQIEEEAKEHDTQMTAIRSKHNQLVEELNNQLDQFKRNKNSLGRFHISKNSQKLLIQNVNLGKHHKNNRGSAKQPFTYKKE